MPRKKPFSNKQKKLQLQLKREKNRSDYQATIESQSTPAEGRGTDEEPEVDEMVIVKKMDQQPAAAKLSYDPNRYRLLFITGSQQEMERRKYEAKTRPLKSVSEEQMETCLEDIFKPGSILDIPKRPAWSYKMSKEQVEQREIKMFESYLHELYCQYKPEQLSFFEHNIETWRQLWRVLEISDVILFITDIRHPVLHFSPVLCNYVISDLGKQLILILNKVDLVPPSLAVAWKHYFQSKFPNLHVICFTSFPRDAATEKEVPGKVHFKLRKKGRRLLSAIGPKELFKTIEVLYKGKADLSAWKIKLEKLADQGVESVDDEDVKSCGAPLPPDNEGLESLDSCDAPIEGILTIGMIGHPNVGKSSLINGLMERKVVSTSRTPGHTKHFQTIFLSPTIRLCDCPGLVFPSLVNRQVQILSGIFPIAQVREPYTAVGYLAERLPLVSLLQLTHPDGPSAEEFEQVWTAWDICDAWALKKQYFTAKAARTDTYRAANSILRFALDGRICMFFTPPGFTSQKAQWESHPEVNEVTVLQDTGLTNLLEDVASESSESSHDEESASQSSPPTVQQHSNRFTTLLDDINSGQDSDQD